MDWLDLLAVQGTLKSLLQHHSSKASIKEMVNYIIDIDIDIDMDIDLDIVKAMVLPVVMYGCESWAIKKAEGRRINA